MKKYYLLLLYTILLSGQVHSQQGLGFLTWFKSDTHQAQFFKNHGLQILKATRLSQHHHLWSITFKSEMQIDRLLTDSNISLAQMNHPVVLRGNIPNDPKFDQQYHLLNSGQAGGLVGADSRVSEVWTYNTGGVTAKNDTIVVAIVDAGCDIDHEDLKDNIFTNYAEIPNDSLDNDSNGYIDDYKGYNVADNNGKLFPSDHGTFIAGVLGAKGNNGKGITGINWQVKMLPLSAKTADEAGVVAAYLYICNQRKLYTSSGGKKGAFIVAANSSFGLDHESPSSLPIWCAMYDTLGAAGVVSAGATINANIDIEQIGDIPSMCASKFLIMATNSDNRDQLSSQAGYSNKYIDLMAAGTNIYSTKPNNQYDTWSGTSFAAPQIAGAVSLLYSAPCKTFCDIYNQYPDSAALLAVNYILKGVDTLAGMKKKTVTGGRLNIKQSMDLLLGSYCYPLAVTDQAYPNDLFVFPNPASTSINISYNVYQAATCQIYDITGRLVLIEQLIGNQKTHQIDISQFPNGIYVVRVGEVVKKISVQH